jgi:DNA-binding transcriptional LysR family regulator
MRSDLDAQATLLDAKLLQLFDLLYRTRSVSRAAEILGQAQPTASIWLGRLRKELGDPLFVRTANGLQPTPRADALIGDARSAIAMLQRLTERDEEFVPTAARRRFRILMTDASHITLLPQILSRLRGAGSALRVDALQIDASAGRKLTEGEADLAIGLIPDLESGFYQQRLYSQDWICLANGRHPRIGDRLSREDYEREGHVEIASGTGHMLLNDALATAKIKRQVILELPGFLGLAGILASTDLIATLPRHSGETLARANRLRVVACPFPIATFEVKQHWHERYHNEPGHRWLRGVVAALFQRPKTTRQAQGSDRASAPRATARVAS